MSIGESYDVERCPNVGRSHGGVSESDDYIVLTMLRLRGKNLKV